LESDIYQEQANSVIADSYWIAVMLILSILSFFLIYFYITPTNIIRCIFYLVFSFATPTPWYKK